MSETLMVGLAVVMGFLTSLLVVLCLTPLVARWAQSLGAVAQPANRKLHEKPIPQWGGIAIFTGLLIGTVIGGAIFLRQGGASAGAQLDRPLLGVLLGAMVMLIVGALDDYFEWRPLPKLLGQLAAACIAVSLGVQVKFFTNPFTSILVFPPLWLVWLISLVWIVGLTNAVNYMDGLDGLAAGICAIAAATLACLAFGMSEVWLVAIVFAAVSGACLGFLRHNAAPARVFMGDCGALTLGFLFGTLCIVGAVKTAVAVGALLVTSIVLGYPIIDTAVSLIRRVSAREPLFRADRKHIHHRLLECGLNQRQVVRILYLLSVVLCVVAVLLSRLVNSKGG